MDIINGKKLSGRRKEVLLQLKARNNCSGQLKPPLNGLILFCPGLVPNPIRMDILKNWGYAWSSGEVNISSCGEWLYAKWPGWAYVFLYISLSNLQFGLLIRWMSHTLPGTAGTRYHCSAGQALTRSSQSYLCFPWFLTTSASLIPIDLRLEERGIEQLFCKAEQCGECTDRYLSRRSFGLA